MIPAEPSPETALPTINAAELGAAPHTAEPISNSSTETRNVPLTLKNVYNFPNSSWNAQLVIRYAAPYQPMSVTERNSFVISGIAVERMSRSNEIRKILTKTDAIIR